MENKINWNFWMLMAMILIWLVVSVYFFIYFKTECKVVTENPYIYAAKRADAEFCSCFLNGGGTLEFDQTRAWQRIGQESQFKIEDINVSKLEEKIKK